jgi:hypothetical protein
MVGVEEAVKYFLDTEFNGFGGALMSLALVPEDVKAHEFYEVVDVAGPIAPWVAQHVVPHLGRRPLPRSTTAVLLATFLRNATLKHGHITIVADWPTDFEHLMALLIIGPGMMESVPDFAMEFKRLPGFNTADHSAVPHNALEDARALRNHCVAMGATA